MENLTCHSGCCEDYADFDCTANTAATALNNPPSPPPPPPGPRPYQESSNTQNIRGVGHLILRPCEDDVISNGNQKVV